MGWTYIRRCPQSFKSTLILRSNMNNQEYKSLLKILDYLREHEKEDYEISNVGAQKTHIYKDIKRVDKWLEMEYPKGF